MNTPKGKFKIVSLKLWSWGRLQWGHELQFITKEAEQELLEAKKNNPEVDFEKLAAGVRSGLIKPL